MLVFPAHAGVILTQGCMPKLTHRFSRTRGGDPAGVAHSANYARVFPAHAGVILFCLEKTKRL